MMNVRRLEWNLIVFKRFLHQRGEVFIFIGFHLMVLFAEMTEQLFEPSREEMSDANVRRQLLQLHPDCFLDTIVTARYYPFELRPVLILVKFCRSSRHMSTKTNHER